MSLATRLVLTEALLFSILTMIRQAINYLNLTPPTAGSAKGENSYRFKLKHLLVRTEMLYKRFYGIIFTLQV